MPKKTRAKFRLSIFRKAQGVRADFDGMLGPDWEPTKRGYCGFGWVNWPEINKQVSGVMIYKDGEYVGSAYRLVKASKPYNWQLVEVRKDVKTLLEAGQILAAARKPQPIVEYPNKKLPLGRII